MQPEIRSFALLLRSPVNHAIWQCEECELFRKVQGFWQRKVWTQRYSRGEKLRCKFFGKEKRKTLRQYWGAHFWQGEVQNSSPILARQWWRHFRLSLSLSLSPNVPHAQYRKRFRASYNSALPIIALGRIWSFVLGFRSVVARLVPFERGGTKRAKNVLAMESVNSLRISAPQWWPLREGRDGKCEGRNEKCEFLARESVSSSPIVRIFGKGKCKFIANFSATMVTSLPSFSVSLSLSLSLKVPHAQYRKRFRASYNYYYYYLKDSPAGWALIEAVSNELRFDQWEKSQG